MTEPNNRRTIADWKPWEKSTGPKTRLGKLRSSLNRARQLNTPKLKRLRSAFLEARAAFRRGDGSGDAYSRAQADYVEYAELVRSVLRGRS